MPERNLRLDQVRHRPGKIRYGVEASGEGYVGVGAPGPEPGAHDDPFRASWGEEGSDLLARHLPTLAARQHNARRQDVLSEPTVLEGAHPQAVCGQPTPDGRTGGARRVDRQAHALETQPIFQLEPRRPGLGLDPAFIVIGQPYAPHQIETDQQPPPTATDPGAVPPPSAASGME